MKTQFKVRLRIRVRQVVFVFRIRVSLQECKTVYCWQQESMFSLDCISCGCVLFLRDHTSLNRFIYILNYLFFRGSLVRWKEGLCHEDKKRSDAQRKERKPQVSYVEGW